MINKNRVRLKGFTLIELMIVITVIAILAAMVLFGLGQAQARARDTQRESNLRAVATALQGYASDHQGGYVPAASSAWNATNLFSATNLGPYLQRLQDPGCGTGTAVNILTTGAPCGTVVYSYTAGANAAATSQCKSATGYYLTVIKEGGGTFELCSPQ